MDTESEIILHVLADLQAFGAALRNEAWWAATYYQNDGRGQLPAWHVKHHGAQYRPAEWVGCPLDPAERQAWSRAVKALEAVGAIDATRAKNRVTHIRLTPKGLCVALQLERDDADLDAIRRTLEIATWATKAHLDAIMAAARTENSTDG